MALTTPKPSVIIALCHHPTRHLTLSRRTITCGPRDNRGPLVRGRTLSTEAILAIQALKRAGSEDAKVEKVVSSSLLRLIKSDLLAVLTELQRQDLWRLALKVFVAVRKEYWAEVDYGVYADMIALLGRNKMLGEIDTLVGDLMEELQDGGVNGDDLRGLAKLLKALVASERGRAVKAIYGAMKTGGCVGDEYLFKILSKGLRKLGEEEAASQVEQDQVSWLDRGGRIEPISF